MDWDGILKHVSSNKSIDYVLQLTEGVDAVCSDDACHLKFHVVAWLKKSSPSNPPLNLHDNLDVGLVMMPQPGFSVLLSTIGTPPSKIELSTLFVANGPCRYCDKISDLYSNFIVTANSWPIFLYEDYKYDPTDPSKGLFKGSILLKVHDSSLIDSDSRFGQC